jgi:transcriptional regulator of arginine metabolism
MSSERRKRHLRILELITTRPVRTQEELAAVLSAEEWKVTQSSVSRDIAVLGLVKVGGAYRRGQPRVPTDPDEQRISEGVLSVERAGDALLVIHTPPGEANRVAVALDRLAWNDIMGTIAGDDTIFIAVRDRAAQARVLRQLKKVGVSAGSPPQD